MPGGLAGNRAKDSTTTFSGLGVVVESCNVIIRETENLVLRELEESDAEDLFRIYSDKETMRFLGRHAASLEEVRDNIRNHIEKYYVGLGFGLWGVVLKSENRLVGRCGVFLQEIEGIRRPELAYLIDRDFWGRGFATEAASAVKRLAIEKYNFKVMIAVIAIRNIASISVAKKCGFGFERAMESFKDFGPVSIYSLEL